MKRFADYLTENKKTYDFKIGIAGELPEKFVDMLETSLQKYGCVSMSNGKKTPIQERPLDFPRLENIEATYFEFSCTYPTTVQVLQEYIGQCCGVPQSHVIVRNPNEPQEVYQEEKTEETYVAKMTQEDMGQAEGDSQADVATSRVMDFLKELETARKDRDSDYLGDVPAGESKDISSEENTKSPIGA